MRRIVSTVVAAALAAGIPAIAHAQEPTIPVGVVAQSSADMFRAPRQYIRRAAEKMPDEFYSFRATPETRTFSELLGHIADGYNLVCASAVGSPLPKDIQQYEKRNASKPELLKILDETAAMCDEAHTSLSTARGGEVIDFAGGKHPRINILFFNTGHAWEHYGNVVTYLRLKGIVPPSSEPRSTK